MIDSFQSIVPGWPTRARSSGLGLFYARAGVAQKLGIAQQLFLLIFALAL